ncbi:hypothetical protein GALMADRAFT_230101 [Galerina marginata CBS 339.88]|uniref:Uncharacterized protein n=1 Tax=Galerina marginata (strain CBS 339.88) TaxID=685588 RepID=A0A067SHT7_GALM3|nr:hypothetical protein GALMADRAFT_230101 [Galerina marginata CBS 339.88]
MATGLLFLISLASFGAGLFVLLDGSFLIPVLITASISALSNILLSLLIVCRLLYHQKYLRRVLGVSHGLVYNKIITICVESCALIIFFMVAYSIMRMSGWLVRWIAFFLLPHICVISALMLVRRVVKGIESTTTIPPLSGVVHRPGLARVEENIQFANPVGTGVMQEGV